MRPTIVEMRDIPPRPVRITLDLYVEDVCENTITIMSSLFLQHRFDKNMQADQARDLQPIYLFSYFIPCKLRLKVLYLP